MNFTIRTETPADFAAVENLIRESFWNVYRPGCLEHYLMHCMRTHPDFIPALSFVMEQDGRIIGQNVFVKCAVALDSGDSLPILSMGPICIAPALKRQGYGLKLLQYSLQKAEQWGAGAVCFEGNIAFYGHVGFTYAQRFGIRYPGLPAGADTSFFLGKELRDGYLKNAAGVYAPSTVYDVDAVACEEYDRAFPPKEKKVLPGQLLQ